MAEGRRTKMRLKYDHTADALYIYLTDVRKPVDGREIDPGTIVDLDESGAAVGIEVIHPARAWPLDAILEAFPIPVNDALELRALWTNTRWGGMKMLYSNAPERVLVG
jgi:uncharacterized protein YuzE